MLRPCLPCSLALPSQNGSDDTRTLAYFSFQRKGFTADTHFEATRSLFSSEFDSKSVPEIARGEFPALEHFKVSSLAALLLAAIAPYPPI